MDQNNGAKIGCQYLESMRNESHAESCGPKHSCKNWLKNWLPISMIARQMVGQQNKIDPAVQHQNGTIIIYCTWQSGKSKFAPPLQVPLTNDALLAVIRGMRVNMQ